MTDGIEIIGLGELLWDCFPDRRRPGGAPANVAFHAQQLGLTTAVASRVGMDDLGDQICEFLVSQGLNTSLIQHDVKRETGTVTISPVSSSHMNYRFLENSAWDFLESSLELLDAVSAARAICFGTLAQRRPGTRMTIERCLQAASKECVIVYDVNLRPPFFSKDWIAKSLARSTVVKLNDEEVKVISRLLNFQSTDEVRFARELLDTYRQLKVVCITRGAQGCLAVSCDEMIELAGIPVEVVDPVGAGDAFTAAIIFGLLANWPLNKTLDLANHFGSLVASRPGAMPVLRNELTSIKSELEWVFRETPPGV